jgi:DNA polymerase-3 subunit epsilon
MAGMAGKLHELLSLQRPLIVLDLETTGIRIGEDRIVELAMVKIHPDGKREVFDRRVNPTISIPPESTAIHGIRDADVAALPPFAEIAREVVEFLAGSDLAGFNIEGFDLPMLQIELGRAGVGFDPTRVLVVDAQLVFHKEEPRTLAAALRLYAGREHENAHAALADVEATALVLAGQLQRYSHMARDPKALAAQYPPPWGRRVDPEGKIIEKAGALCFGFGKHRGRTFEQVFAEDPDYFSRFILAKGFSPQVKTLARDFLRSKSGQGVLSS